MKEFIKKHIKPALTLIALITLLGESLTYSATLVKVQNINPTQETVIIQQNNGVAFNLVYGAQAEFSYEGYVKQLIDGGVLSIISTTYDAATLTGSGLAAAATSTSVVNANPVITSISGTITSGGTSQTLRAANTSDREIEIYNNDSTEPLCINPSGGTASASAAGNICLPALGYYSTSLNNQAVTIVAATTSHKFSAFIRQ